MSQAPQNVFLSCPTHNGQLDYRMAQAFYVNATNKYNILNTVVQSSLLANGCNNLWCKALNLRDKYNLKWFAMLHADVVPEPFWLDKLIDIAEKNDADLLSAIVPIKSSDGVTSTAISRPDNFMSLFRLTQHQVNKVLPKTFALKDIPRIQYPFDQIDERSHLLVNTGCMVVRLDRPWSEKLLFTINDAIKQKFNEFYAEVQPEDWFFSRSVAEHGGKVMATSEVRLQHLGNNGYDSASVWGSEIDPAYSPLAIQ